MINTLKCNYVVPVPLENVFFYASRDFLSLTGTFRKLHIETMVSVYINILDKSFDIVLGLSGEHTYFLQWHMSFLV